MHDPITLTVNGEKHTVAVAPRTQLAEVLRDHLELTGTHLGCEQGVCGACTVMVDGKPVRSCITFVGRHAGSVIETIEGFEGDPWMARLRDAFSQHHALQCGFCTPGMLATARDIVERFSDPDEATIRHELSGNLCRCTGYMGIVAAIRDVARQRIAAGETAAETERPAPRKTGGLTGFEPLVRQSRQTEKMSPVTVRDDGDWTVVERRVVLQHPPDRVWALFADIRQVGRCVPGANIAAVLEDTFSGTIEIRFGPIKANIAGDGRFAMNDAKKSGQIEGRGADANGQSNIEGQLRFRASGAGRSSATQVDLELRYRIEGILAQFNRKDLVASFVDQFLRQFAGNCDAVLSGSELAGDNRLNALALGLDVLRSKLRSLFGKH